MSLPAITAANTDSQANVWRSAPNMPRNRGSKHPYNKQFLRTLYRRSTKDLLTRRIDTWLEQTAWLSSITSMTRHPLYGEIISDGADAFDLILERMNRGEVRLHWFPVLQDITKADPVPPYSRGNLPEMAEVWIKWAKANRAA